MCDKQVRRCYAVDDMAGFVFVAQYWHLSKSTMRPGQERRLKLVEIGRLVVGWISIQRLNDPSSGAQLFLLLPMKDELLERM